MTSRYPAVAVLGILAFASGARADSFKAPPFQEGAHVSIQAYGRQNPDCLNWTNGCVLCTRDKAGQSQCSTPGIACLPHGLTCKALRPK